MATINCTLGQNSSWYRVYFEYTYTQDAINSKTTLSHALKLEQLTDSNDFDTSREVTLSYKVDGKTFSKTARVNINDKGNKGYTITLVSGSSTISHDTTTGKGSFKVSVDTGQDGMSSGGWGTGTIKLSERSIALPTIDRTAPTVTHSASSLALDGFKITISASDTCDIFQYSIDGGESYTTCSTTEGKTASVTLSDIDSAIYSVRTRARKKVNQLYGYSEKDDVDIRPPGSIELVISNITVDSFKLTLSSSATCDRFDYSIDGGSTYTTFSTTEGSSATINVSGLSANTSYSVRARVRRKLNSLYGYSAKSTVKTLGASVLTEAPSFAADEETPVIAFECTVYEASFYHKVLLELSSETVQIGTFKASAGSVSKSFDVSSANRTKILSDMSTVKTKSMKLILETYTDNTYTSKVGSTSTKTITATTSKALSAPSFSSFTYKDNSEAVVGVTGNDQILVQSVSDLLVTCTAGTAKNGAKIKNYSVIIGEATATSTSTNVPVGAVETEGDLKLTVTCTDSRGYSKEKSVTVTVVKYEPPKITKFVVERKNGVEAIVGVQATGSYSPLVIDGEQKNKITSLRYKCKELEGEWPEAGTKFTPDTDYTTSTSSFSVNVVDLGIECDTDSTYYFYFYAYDKINNALFNKYATRSSLVTLSPSKPAISFRKKNSSYNFRRVGIFNNEPKLPFDVGADDESKALGINGKPMIDFVVEQGIKGIWTYRKWNSGIAECWGFNPFTEHGVTSAYSSLFRSDSAIAGVNYPFTFSDVPCLTTSVQRDTDFYNVWLLTSVPGTASKTATLYLLATTSVTTQGTIHYYAIGRWK